jgi:hypothetical protein
MISFKQYIQEEKDDKSFVYVKLPALKNQDHKIIVEFKNKKRAILADIVYSNIYKIPTWKGDVDHTKLDQIKIHDVDVHDLLNIKEISYDDNNQITYYSPFKPGTSQEDAHYLKSLYAYSFVEELLKNFDTTLRFRHTLTTITKYAQIELQRRRGNNIL